MRATSILIALLGATVLASPAAAQSKPPSWCAFSDSTSCGYASKDQCQLSIRGQGGFCELELVAKKVAAKPAPKPKPAAKPRDAGLPPQIERFH